MYDALDKRNYKQAIKIANKAKRPTDILIVLKAHACERLGKFEEALDICLGVKKRLIPEEYLVNHLTMVFNNLGYPKHATESVAKACESLKKSSPLLENFLKQLFFCHGKERQYLLQQQTAMKLYRQYKKPEYALWVATTMVLQIDNNTGNANMLMKNGDKVPEDCAGDFTRARWTSIGVILKYFIARRAISRGNNVFKIFS